jgi:hypothetical protein
MRLRITGNLAKTLCSTNPCESMIEIVRYTPRNLKHRRGGDMREHPRDPRPAGGRRARYRLTV